MKAQNKQVKCYISLEAIRKLNELRPATPHSRTAGDVLNAVAKFPYDWETLLYLITHPENKIVLSGTQKS